MTEQEQIRKAEAEVARLAALAAEPPIAAAAADPEVGDEVLADLSAPELAAAHAMMMQLASAAGAVLDWPFGPPGLAQPGEVAAHDRNDAIDLAPAALAAARLAGGACRMMEQVRLGLAARGSPPAPDDHWRALSWGEELCSEAELRRRQAAAQAAIAAGSFAAPVSAGARKVQEHARASAAVLAAEVGAGNLAVAIADPSDDFLCRVFAHELASAHGLYMRLASRFAPALARATRRRQEPVAALRIANACARLSVRLGRGRATLAKVRKSRAGGPGGSGGGRRRTHSDAAGNWTGPYGGSVPPEPAPSAAQGPVLAGHGVDRPDSSVPADPATASARIQHKVHSEASFDQPSSESKIPFSVPSSTSVLNPSLAGHLGAEALCAKAAGVDRPDSKFVRAAAVGATSVQSAKGRLSQRQSPLHKMHRRLSAFIGGRNPSLAGHGVDRPIRPSPRPCRLTARPAAVHKAAHA
jgi:hypothetical protein